MIAVKLLQPNRISLSQDNCWPVLWAYAPRMSGTMSSSNNRQANYSRLQDEFQIAYTDYEKQTAENAMSFGLVAPSLTPTSKRDSHL